MAQKQERVTALQFKTGQRAALAELRRRVGSGLRVHFRPDSLTPRQIRGGRLQLRVRGRSGKPTDEATAREFLRSNRQLLRLQDPDRELVLKRRRIGRSGRSHLRFAQYHRGLRVWPFSSSLVSRR